jgi:hypothetical protein
VTGGNALGGGLFVSGKTARISAVARRTRIVGNIAQRSMGASAVGSTSPRVGAGGSSLGGGLYVGNLTLVTLAQVLTAGNTADTYTGTTNIDQGVIVEGGGAYVGAGGALTLNDTAVTLNAALPNALVGTSAGGGVFVFSGGTLNAEGSTSIEQNFARKYPDLLPPGGKP